MNVVGVLALLTLVVTSAPAAAQSTERDRADAVRHVRLGQDLMQAERWDEAEREFKAAIRLDPLLELAHYGLGQVYMATKRYADAVRAYRDCRNAIEHNSSQDATNRAISDQRVLDQIHELENRKRLLEQGAQRTTNTSGSVQQLDMMIRDLESRRKRSAGPTPRAPAWISIALGSAYFRNQALADAEREYLEALKADPKLGEAHNNLAVVLMMTGRYDEAEREVTAAEKTGFKVNPQFKRDLADKRKGRP
jgi:Tfp pilus assembly protein PilF